MDVGLEKGKQLLTTDEKDLLLVDFATLKTLAAHPCEECFGYPPAYVKKAITEDFKELPEWDGGDISKKCKHILSLECLTVKDGGFIRKFNYCTKCKIVRERKYSTVNPDDIQEIIEYDGDRCVTSDKKAKDILNILLRIERRN